jgi:protein-S-isoprenylcysteine O-methyltransferase Ste14
VAGTRRSKGADLADDYEGEMSRLELKVPPDLVALGVAALMWLVSTVTPPLTVPLAVVRLVAIALLAAGIVLIVSARVSFTRAGTTWSPVAPRLSRQLVTAGVYRYTRNPMYLGTLLVLLALGARLANPVAAIVALAYVAYMNRFQILPEERVLRARFGDAYVRYARSVRRWV